MKKIISLLLFLFLFTQQNGWSQQISGLGNTWTHVDTLEKKGLYRSAWDQVKKIYADAVQHHDDQQQIKALIYQLKYRDKIEENANVKNIYEVDSLMQHTDGTQKAILRSMLAEMYWRYVQSNRYTLYNRITSTAEKAEDVTTWSLTHLYDQIALLYKASLQHADDLKKIDLSTLSVIADTGIHTLNLQPALFDLLAHRALDYFTGEEQNVIKPAARFIIHEVSAFDPASAFSQVHFSPGDTASLSLYALHLYQRLIRFHLQDQDPAALIDVDLQRLQFVYRKAVMPGKDSLYRMALEHIIDQYGHAPATSEASYLLAQWYFNQGSQYDPVTHPATRFDLKKAKEICDKISLSPVTSGSLSCRQLKDNILHPDIALQVEQVNVPRKPFRVLVKYKNASRLWFRLVKLPEDPKTVFADNNPKLPYLLKKNAVKSWEQAFPDPGDFQHHAAEMKIDGLPHGRYALLVSGDKHFTEGKFPVESTVFYVSDISYVQNGKGDYLVLNRETGQPLSNAAIRIWRTHYNQTARKTELEEAGHFKTDQHGYIHIKAAPKYQTIIPEISWENDHLFTGQQQWIPLVGSADNKKDTTVQKTYLFTDRSIYRPGQTVYFKGITFNFNEATHQSEVINHKQVTITLIDGNGQKADSLKLTSNDFGSYAGSFVLPKGLLNGYMHLAVKDNQATAYFSVEDYKRPTFYLQWDTTSHECRLGDTVQAKGSVVAYSGAVIDGATVKYQVTRSTRVVYPWPRTGGNMIMPPHSNVTSITQGITTTDDKGTFSIRFPAIPDETTDSAWSPVFIYTVSADVTDRNGESHHFSYGLPLGYQSLELKLNIDDKIEVSRLDTLYLSSTNLSGKFVATPVNITLYPLDAPKRYIRQRYWSQPDEFIMDKKDYVQYFPHDEYKNEADPSTWSKGAAVLTEEGTTTVKGEMALPMKTIDPGWYAIQVNARDKYGRPVNTTKYVQVYDKRSTKPVFTDPLWISRSELNAAVGKTASWKTAAGTKTYITIQDERLAQTGSLENQWLDSTTKQVMYPVSDADRGGVIRHYIAVRYNRLFTEDVNIRVPWKNKQLHIQYETFRDKLLPGAQEQWKMKITGADGEKVSAELLASMYDASLDAFRQHQWPQPDIYPLNYGKINWQGGQSFKDVSSYILFNPKRPAYPVYKKVYPSLRWFGYNLVHPPAPVYIRGMAAGMSPNAQARNEARTFKTALNESVVVGYDKAEDTTVGVANEPAVQSMLVRKNFNETAFFFPQLHTDDSGNVVFSFTIPEALTKWKLMMFAHTKDMRYAFSEKKTVTQKPLMIQANAPRFVRQGDRLIFSAKVSNLSKENLNGNAELILTDAATGDLLDDLFKNTEATHPFTVQAGQSAVVKWTMAIPDGYTGVLSYKVVAAAGNYSDGEQNALPVLTNRTLVTESLPLNFRGNGRHELNFDAVEKMRGSSTLQPQGMTIEYTGNPAWYAVQALPFLDENKQQSADVLYDRIYANALSGFIAKKIPHFKDVMQQWLTSDTNALKSALQENEDLKSVLLQETPWVEAAQDENAQKARVAQWFNGEEAKERMRGDVNRLEKMQLSNGGFSWFRDMPDDRYITQQIITGIGHLKHLNAWPEKGTGVLQAIVQKAIPYLDARMKESYDELKKSKAEKPSLTPTDIQYLYMRSFFPEIKMADSIKAAYNFYQVLAGKDWTGQSHYRQAMIALALNRSGKVNTAKAILKSLSETAVEDEVSGMHWKASRASYRWYQAPVEAQAVCIEAFNEINNDRETVDDLRTWLLTQKQTQHWATTSATADAVYALLLTGGQWTDASPEVTIKAGDKRFVFNDKKGEAGTQYQKVYIPGKEIDPAMGKIDVKIKGAEKKQPSWGAVYFQYFEDMNKLHNSSSGLGISREISLEKTTPEGPKLIPVTGKTTLQVGDKVQIRLIVKVNQDMDYVHLKDVRASCMEPLQTLSGYYWNNGTGYYAMVTDAAMHYYFPHLKQGTYVFTYPVYITHAGNYTGGMSTLECLYAPSFRAHSEGTGVVIREQ